MIYPIILSLSLIDPQVIRLINELGDNSWHHRDAVTRKLIKMDERPVLLLRIMGATNPDAEIAMRSRMVLDRYYNSAKPPNGKWPYIECLPKDYPNRAKVLEEVFKVYGDPSYGTDGDGGDEYDGEIYRTATCEFAHKLMREGASRSHVVAILKIMTKNEAQWEEDGGRNSSYPPEFKK